MVKVWSWYANLFVNELQIWFYFLVDLLYIHLVEQIFLINVLFCSERFYYHVTPKEKVKKIFLGMCQTILLGQWWWSGVQSG